MKKRKTWFPLYDGVYGYYVLGKLLINDNGEIKGAVTTSMDISELII